MTGPVTAFRRWAAEPPRWMGILLVPTFAFVAFGLASKRNWVVGVAGGIIYGVVAFAFLAVRGGVVAWGRRHPILDGAMLGPILFAALAYLTTWSLWICLLLGAVGVAVGAVRGAQRGRRWARSSESSAA